MIVARLRVETDPATGHQRLVGRTVSNWPLAVGTLLVLRKRAGEYELLELGTRERRCDQQAVLSFCCDDDDSQQRKDE